MCDVFSSARPFDVAAVCDYERIVGWILTFGQDPEHAHILRTAVDILRNIYAETPNRTPRDLRGRESYHTSGQQRQTRAHITWQTLCDSIHRR